MQTFRDDRRLIMINCERQRNPSNVHNLLMLLFKPGFILVKQAFEVRYVGMKTRFKLSVVL